MDTRKIIEAHRPNADDIIAAISRTGTRQPPAAEEGAASLSPRGAKEYQHYLLHRFGDVIGKASFDYISKTPDSWLMVGDRRPEIAADIQLVIERHGIGIGMLVLHAQQIRAQHILTRIMVEGREQDLSRPTESLRGARGENVLWVPLRQYRVDVEGLAALNIAKPKRLWEPSRIVTHERDRNPCFYCSCAEINPSEVVVGIEASRHGLSRSYSFGFTFAPFGSPVSAVHFLAWDNSRKPLNMSRTPMTVSDLVKLTRQINLSIRDFFAHTGIKDYPVLDGLFNGWAGNTIFHQHFQFFQPEFVSPIERPEFVAQTPLLRRDDVTVERLVWPAPIYCINAGDALNTGLVGNDTAGLWRYVGGSRKVPYKTFGEGFELGESEKIPAHTHNLYVPGNRLGETLYLVLRDRERVDFKPSPADRVNEAAGYCAQRKDNIGVLEATGTMIVDTRAIFDEMSRWNPEDVSEQIKRMASAIAPDEDAVTAFEHAVKDLFPQ